MICIGVLILFGLVVRVAVHSSINDEFKYIPEFFGICIGISVGGIGFFVDYRKIVKYAGFFYVGLLLILLMIIEWGVVIHGQHGLVPYVMLLFPIVVVGIVYRLKGKGMWGLFLSELVMAVPILIGIWQSYFSSIIIYASAMAILLLYTIAKRWFGCSRSVSVTSVLLWICMGAVIICSKGFTRYGFYRMYAGIHPEVDPDGAGWIALQVRDILKQAHLWGASTKELNLPTADTNYLLTFLIHHFGWIAFILVMVIFSILIAQGIRMCLKEKDFLGRSLSSVILVGFSLQTVFYVINNLGVAVFGGYPLPFISGNVSMVINLFLMGVLLSVFRNGLVYTKLETEMICEERKFLEITDGKIIIFYK